MLPQRPKLDPISAGTVYLNGDVIVKYQMMILGLSIDHQGQVVVNVDGVGL